MASEEITGAGDDGDPGGRSHEIKQREGTPGHAQDSSERAGDNAHTENEAGKKNCERAIAGEEGLTTGECAWFDVKKFVVTIEEPAATVVADGVPQIVAQGGRAGSYHDDPSKLKSMFGIRQEAGEEQRSLSRDREPGILAEKRDSNGPVSVVGDKLPQMVEEVQVQRVAGRSQKLEVRLQK